MNESNEKVMTGRPQLSDVIEEQIGFNERQVTRITQDLPVVLTRSELLCDSQLNGHFYRRDRVP